MKTRVLFLTLLTMLISLTSFAETSNTQSKTSDSLSDISTFEQTFVHYTKEAMEAGKESVSQAVDFIITEGIVITKQYIIFTSIKFLIPILIGLFLIFWVSNKIYIRTGYTKASGVIHNQNIDSLDLPEYKKPNKWKLVLGRYYSSSTSALISIIFSGTPLVLGIYLIYINLITFIKVTFFSKLYLTELAIKYLS